MPVDPYGTGVFADYYGYDSSYDQPSWWDLTRDAIREAAETAQIVAQGYPPGSTIVYAPQYPGGPSVPVVQPPQEQPHPYYPLPLPPMGPGPGPAPAPSQGGAGINLSNTTLMLLVGGFLLFSLGSKRGR